MEESAAMPSRCSVARSSFACGLSAARAGASDRAAAMTDTIHLFMVRPCGLLLSEMVGCDDGCSMRKEKNERKYSLAKVWQIGVDG